MTLRPRAWTAALGPGLSLLIHLPLLLPGRSAGFRDLASTHEPLRSLAARAWLGGEVPHWNPFPDGGAPLLANPNAGVLHPSLVTSLLFSGPLALTLAIVLQQALGSLAVYGLARRHGGDALSAAVASMAWAGAGPALSMGTTLNQLNGFAWVPVAALAVGWAADRGGWRSIPAAAALASVLIAGAPVAAGAVLFLVGLELAFAPAAVGGTRPSPGRRWMRVAVSGAGGALLAAPGLIPFIMLLGRAERTAGFPVSLAQRWSVAPERLLEAVVPFPMGNPAYVASPGWYGSSAFDAGLPLVLSVFVGAPVIVLAVTALVARRRDPVTVCLGIFVLGCVLVALGRHAPFHAWLSAVPGLPPLRYPSKFLVPASLGLALLAGRGCVPLLGAARGRRRKWLWGGAAVAATATILLLSAPTAWSQLEGLAGRFPGIAGSSVRGLATWLQGQILIGLGAATLVLLVPLVARVRVPVATTLLGAVVAGSLVSGSWGVSDGSLDLMANPSLPRTALTDELPEYREALASAGVPPGRVLRLPPPSGAGLTSPRGYRPEVYQRSRVLLRHHVSGPAGVGTALELQPDRMGLYGTAALRARLRTLPPASGAALARRLGVSVVDSFGEPDWPDLEPLATMKLRYSTPPLQVSSLRDALPPARLVPGAYHAVDDQDAFEKITSDELHPRTTVVLSGVEGSPLAGAGQVGEARLARRGLSALSVDVDAAADAWLVLTENHDPGWSATLDGEPVPLQRADIVLNAIRVPSGRHEVVLRYRTPGWTAGLVAAALGLVLLSGAAWVDRRTEG